MALSNSSEEKNIFNCLCICFASQSPMPKTLPKTWRSRFDETPRTPAFVVPFNPLRSMSSTVIHSKSPSVVVAVAVVVSLRLPLVVAFIVLGALASFTATRIAPSVANSTPQSFTSCHFVFFLHRARYRDTNACFARGKYWIKFCRYCLPATSGSVNTITSSASTMPLLSPSLPLSSSFTHPALRSTARTIFG